MHASSCGNVERAILYAEKALQLITQQPDGISFLQYNPCGTAPHCRCRCQYTSVQHVKSSHYGDNDQL